MTRKRMKGQGGAETSFIIFFMVFIAVLVWLFPEMSQTFPSAGLGSFGFDFVFFGAAAIGVGIACTVAAGIGCLVTLALFEVVTLFVIPPILAVLFAPLLAIYSYVVARLARGGG
jgi:hypothetical protein